MDLRQLRYLTVLAEESDLSVAAARLEVSERDVNRQIGDLEGELGVRLLVDTGSGITLTDAGGAVLEDARAVLHAAEQVTRRARAAARSAPDVARVGFTAATAGPLLSWAVRRMRLQRPDIRLDLVGHPLAEPAAGLDDGTVDVALVWGPLPLDGVEKVDLLRRGRVVVLPSSHRLAGAPSLRLADLAGERLLAPAARDDAGTWAWVRAWFAGAGREGGQVPGGMDDTLDDGAAGGAADPARLTLVPHARDLDDLVTEVLAGTGVVLMPAGLGEGVAGAAVSRVPVVDAPPAVLAVAWRTGDLSPASAAFVSAAQREAVDHAPGSHGHAGLHDHREGV